MIKVQVPLLIASSTNKEQTMFYLFVQVNYALVFMLKNNTFYTLHIQNMFKISYNY